MSSGQIAWWLRRAWRRGRHWWIVAVALAVVIFWLSSMPGEAMFTPGPPDGILNAVFKKSAHVIVYGALAIALARALGVGTRSWMLAFLIAVLYGVFDEWHQSFVPGREATLRDLGFDALGAGFALWVHQRLLLFEMRWRDIPPVTASRRR